MPSLFEPGGIVQHEFFLGGTPVIAFRTGGLKDTVFEFNWDNNSGNGLTFDNYNKENLLIAFIELLIYSKIKINIINVEKMLLIVLLMLRMYQKIG